MHVPREPDLPSNWYEQFFTDTYRRYDLERQPEQKTRSQVHCVLDALQLQPGSRVLDLGCGTGRHALLFTAQGMDVTGVDLSPEYLEYAQTAARRADLTARFVRADMRDLSELGDAEFDAVASLHTSFGLFHAPHDNLRVLQEVVRVLRPGGRLFIDVLNRDWWLRTIGLSYWEHREPETVNRDYDDVDGRLILHERAFQPLTSMLRWSITPVASPEEAAVAEWRLYSAHELTELLERAGLVVTTVLGDYEGGPFHALAPRLICIGDKS